MNLAGTEVLKQLGQRGLKVFVTQLRFESEDRNLRVYVIVF